MSMRSTILGVSALVLASTACQPPAQEPAGLSDEDVAAIRQVGQTYAQAARAGDWVAWTATFAEGAIYMLPNAPAVEGHAALRDMAQTFPPLTDLKFMIGEIDGRGDLAFARGEYSASMPVEGGAEPVEEVGKWLWILRKTPDGTWRITHECYNTDLPLPEEAVETET